MNMFLQFLVILILLFNISILLRLWYESRNLRKSAHVDIVDVHQIKFKYYLKQFNKKYYAYEYNMRLQNFKVSLSKIARMNALEGYPVFGLTQFSDMSEQELADHVGIKPEEKECRALNITCDYTHSRKTNNDWIKCSDSNADIPDKCDWRKKGVIGKIRDQKECLDCWAFSIVGLMESMAAIQGVSHKTFSVQELLDCSLLYNGCFRGRVDSALNYLCNTEQGIVSEDQYPLTVIRRYGGRYEVPVNGVRIKQYWHQCNMKESDILRLVAHHGPVAVVVNEAPLYHYVGGIIRRACVRGKDSIDHVVQIVGFDLTGIIPYYIVRNSWGTHYGDNGYVKLAINYNVCGLADEVTALTVEMSR
ncbi:cathepsin O-like [Anticarsia gemmatalis]|uniref:cathepsin O-like n=1 Tax=Anticarsia gemmatalis TaxID=129554 RepID=UPI003F76F6BE